MIFFCVVCTDSVLSVPFNVGFFFGDIFEELQFVLPDASLDDADLWTNPYITSPAFTVQTFFNGVYSMSPTAALLNTDVICKGDATCSVVAFSMYFISNLNLYCLEGDSDENSCGVTCADGSSCLNVTVFCDTPIPLIPSNGTYCEAVGGNLDGNNVDIQYFNVSNAVTTEISEPLATTTGIVDTSTTMRYYENVGDSVAVSDVPQYGLGHIIAALGGVVTSLICCVGLCIFTVRRVRMKRKLDLHTVTNTDMDQVVMNAIDTSEASHGVERGPGTSVTIGSVVIPNGGSSPQLEERALIADIEGKGAQSVSIVSREASACFMNNGGYTEYAEGMQTGHGTIR